MLSMWHNPYYVPLFLAVFIKFVPEEYISDVKKLKTICEYDTLQMCPECFTDPPNCDNIDALFRPLEESWSNRINSLFNVHSTTIGTFNGPNTVAVMQRLNRDDSIERLRLEFCKTRSFHMVHCSWSVAGNVDQAVEYVKNAILEESRIEGCIICPSSAKRQILQRLLETMQPPAANDLRNLLTIYANVEPLLLTLMSLHDGSFPVPKVLHSVGFSVIESYDGEPLSNFYHIPLPGRMLIARELIKAAISFTNGINGFRFFLTDINPDNVVVRFGKDHKNVSVSIVDLDNVIILDSTVEGIHADRQYHMHSKIECDGCFAYVQEDVCSYRNSDLNLFSICQLLLENLNGNSMTGLLHSDHSKQSNGDALTGSGSFEELQSLLQECVYCRPPDCRNRSLILDDVLQVLHRQVEQ